MRQDTRDQDKDAVDRIIEEWRRERPDLDPGGKSITGRIVRLAGLVHARLGGAAASHGLSNGDFGILAALRRTGAPYERTPSELTRHLVVTTGGMTAMIDRLEASGLVERAPNPADRRGVLVRLTPAGVDVIDAAMVDHAAAEQEIVSGLSRTEREQLAGLLRSLLLHLDAPV